MFCTGRCHISHRGSVRGGGGGGTADGMSDRLICDSPSVFFTAPGLLILMFTEAAPRDVLTRRSRRFIKKKSQMCT